MPARYTELESATEFNRGVLRGITGNDDVDQREITRGVFAAIIHDNRLRVTMPKGKAAAGSRASMADDGELSPAYLALQPKITRDNAAITHIDRLTEYAVDPTLSLIPSQIKPLNHLSESFLDVSKVDGLAMVNSVDQIDFYEGVSTPVLSALVGFLIASNPIGWLYAATAMSHAMPVRLPAQSLMAIWDDGVPQIMAAKNESDWRYFCGPYVKFRNASGLKSSDPHFISFQSILETGFFEHDYLGIYVVPDGQVMPIMVGARPELLGPGIYVKSTPNITVQKHNQSPLLISQSSALIQNKTFNVVSVPEGKYCFGKDNNQPFILPNGKWVVRSDTITFSMSEANSLKLNSLADCYHEFHTLTMLKIPKDMVVTGTIGETQILLPQGTYFIQTDQLKLELNETGSPLIPIDGRTVIPIGPYTLITVPNGQAVITKNNGAYEVFGQVAEPGLAQSSELRTYLLDHRNWNFVGAIDTSVQFDNLETAELFSKDHAAMRFKSTVRWRVIDVKNASRQCGNLNPGQSIMDKLQLLVDKEARAALSKMVQGVNVNDEKQFELLGKAKPSHDSMESELPPDYNSHMLAECSADILAECNEALRPIGVQVGRIAITERQYTHEDTRANLAKTAAIHTDLRVADAKRLAAKQAADAEAYERVTLAEADAKAISLVSDAHKAAAEKLGDDPSTTGAQLALTGAMKDIYASCKNVTVFASGLSPQLLLNPDSVRAPVAGAGS